MYNQNMTTTSSSNSSYYIPTTYTSSSTNLFPMNIVMYFTHWFSKGRLFINWQERDGLKFMPKSDVINCPIREEVGSIVTTLIDNNYNVLLHHLDELKLECLL